MSTTRERYLEWRTRSLLPQLPIELWAQIFSYLTTGDLFPVRLVSRLFYSCVNQHTSFWSRTILDIDQCPTYAVTSNLLRRISSSNIDLLTKSNLYSHCQVYLKPQPLKNSFAKRRKRRLLIAHQEDEQSQKQLPYLHCSAVHFDSLRSFYTFQLECLLKQRVRRLEFSYECLSTEPSLNFLFKLERLKYLKISFLHNIFELDTFTVMLINTMQGIVSSLLQLTSQMILSQRMLLTDGLTLFGLIFIGLLGDCLCFGRPWSHYVLSNTYLRVMTDNLTHGLISVFATSFLFGWTRRSLLILAFIAGSFVDVDHFIEVRSLSLHCALHEQPRSRPFLHNSLILLITTLLIIALEHFLTRQSYISYSLIFFLGWATHHIRDAQRRGLNFLPLGETAPIEYYLPIIGVVLLAMKAF